MHNGKAMIWKKNNENNEINGENNNNDNEMK